MRVVPSLDLRRGSVVRLLKGDFERLTTYAPDPVPLARAYAEAGARRLHVVDLDAALGDGDNRAHVERLVRELGIEVQVAGGVRTAEDVDRWLDCGAAATVMGTTAVRAPDVLAGIAARHPGRVLAALDVRAGRPAVTGWSDVEAITVPAMLDRWADARLAGVVLTSIDRDGTLRGPDLDVLRLAAASTLHPLTYSGGIGTLDDLAAIAAAGAGAVILGKSLLEGRFTLGDAIAKGL